MEISVLKIKVDNYNAVISELKSKIGERKKKQAEKEKIPPIKIFKHRELTQQINDLSEQIEELKTEKNTILSNLKATDIKAVKEGRCDIGLSSRDLTEEEKKELVGTVVAIDGIAVIVNPENSVDDLSLEQISAMYKGEITNWKEVGGADTPVVLIGREAASGTRDGFESITDTSDKCKYSQELTSSGDVIQTVASNPNAIGYASLASVKDSVKAISVDSVYPSKQTIQNGSYKIQRDFVFVTKKNAVLSGVAKDFFDKIQIRKMTFSMSFTKRIK